MSLATLHYRSAVLAKSTAMTVLLPDRGAPPFAALYLLHGLSDDHTAWTRKTRLETYAAAHELMIVMPDGGRGFYTDHAAGPAFGRHLAEEVVAVAERCFPADPRRERRGVGGLSMGGYGAVRAALAHPDRFASAHSHSGAVGHGGSACAPRPDLFPDDEFRRIFGPEPAGTNHDLLALARRVVAGGGPAPAIRLDCGTEDFLLADNRRFHADLTAVGLAHDYAEHPGGHDWNYWDTHVRDALAFHARVLADDSEPPV